MLYPSYLIKNLTNVHCKHWSVYFNADDLRNFTV